MATLTRTRTVCAFVSTTLVLCVAAPASAQLYEVTRATDPSWRTGFGSGAAYDPVHDCYFVISGYGSVNGRFINRDGATIGTVTFDTRDGTEIAEVAYSSDVSDGAGGFGGFLTIWTLRGVPGLFGQIVAFPVGLVGPRVTIRATQPGELELNGGIAYSPVHHVFLVAVGFTTFPSGSYPTRIVRLNQNAQPIDDIPLSFEPSYSCLNFEFSVSCNHVDVAWNPISNEFAVVYNQGDDKTLARVSGNGTALSRTTLGISPLWGALAVNTTTGNYLAVGGGDGARTDGAEVSPGGAVVARGLVTSSLDTLSHQGGMMRLSYSTASGTFLLTGSGGSVCVICPTDGRPRLLELNQHGVPAGGVLVLPDSHPTVIASHAAAPEWLTATGLGTRYIIGTLTPFGGSDSQLLSDCVTPDPFVAFGGGTCVNGGWFFPDMTLPPPLPVPGGCITPDPFVAFGGGTCVSGGWFPPGVTAPPPPPPVPGGCITPDPFVAFGGGTCVNGGWYPPGVTAPPPPPPVPGGCITPDPFVAFGGGTCVNGGWFPPGSASAPTGKINDGGANRGRRSTFVFMEYDAAW